MNGSAASVAYLILSVFWGGFTLGVVAAVAVAIRREDRRFSLYGAAPGATAQGARFAHPLRQRRLSVPAARLGATMNDSVVAIVSAFFVIGIFGGVIAVIALSAIRAHRPGRPGGPRRSAAITGPASHRLGGFRSRGTSRWPGDVDTDFSGR